MPKFIYNDYKGAKKVLTTLELELERCDEFIFSVAFISESGLVTLLQTLKNLEDNNIKGRILTTNYLYFNSPRVLDKLSKFTNIELKVYDTDKLGHGFHTKGYMFKNNGSLRVLTGSSNLTSAALTINKEWNSLIDDVNFTSEMLNEFENLWQNADDYDNIKEKYLIAYNENKSREQNITEEIGSNVISPNNMQKSFIKNFLTVREIDTRALLVSATGTGKTYAAAFAMESIKAKKILFVVHREQIARTAMETFKKVFGTTRTYGMLVGSERNIDADFIFATVQTLSKDEVLHSFSKNYFDEIIIDEVHRAGASSYIKVMDYFEPKFYLGMTASPDRTDDFNIYELFHNNIVYEVRLQEAMEEDLLCPFHYFGVTDLEIDGNVSDDFTLFNNIVTDTRVDHIIDKITYYGYSGTRVKGLVFCSAKQEAKVLSKKFNERGYKTVALSGEHSVDYRNEMIEKLVTDGEDYLDYIFTVDIFNEGIDIPEVNQVVMLRPTMSSIIFIQQLGRGLRKSKGKDFVVIIDFIANYNNNFLIPVALSGDNSYDKDSLRKFLARGNNYLAGTSTIHFDEISKEKIYRSIDNARLSTMALLAESYNKLKYRLGRIPTYYDFDNNDTISMLKIFRVAGSYHSFLVAKDRDYKIKFNAIQINMLKFVAQNLILSKKVEELVLLKILIENSGDVKDKFLNYMEENYDRKLEDYQLDVIKKIVTNSFVTSSVTKKKFSDCIFLENRDGFYIANDFKQQLEDELFKEELLELINYGITKYDENYKNQLYKNTLFKLYEKYNFEDICKLFSWSINYVPLAIGGYKYDEMTKTLPVFINYDIDENSFNHDYVHGFLPNDEFTSMSKPRRNLQSKEVDYFYDNDTKIYLFMRKNKNDKDGASEFYFLGEMKTTGEPKLVEREKSKDTVIQFFFKMLTPVREDLYEYFTRDKV